MDCRPGLAACFRSVVRSLRFCFTALLVLLVACERPGTEQCLREAMSDTGLESGILQVDTGGVVRRVASTAGAEERFKQSVMAASLTKPIVAAEVRRQVDAGRLVLDTPISDLLPDVALGSGKAGVTLRRLLQHTAGFDHELSGDPLFEGRAAQRCPVAAKRVLARPLDFPPGSRIAYSNAGYCLLGEVVLRTDTSLTPQLRNALSSHLGAAGGWRTPLPILFQALKQTLPLQALPAEARLPDGSYYSYGWRHWPDGSGEPPWTHFGRLPGMLSVAMSDGRSRLLVAHFLGDPVDYNETAEQFSRNAWRCLPDWHGGVPQLPEHKPTGTPAR